MTTRAAAAISAGLLLACGNVSPAGIDAGSGLDAALASPDACVATTGEFTFGYLGAPQTFTVPSCVTSIVVDAYGAAGATVGDSPGGLGGRAQASVAVTPGEDLTIIVGGAGFVANTTEFGGYGGGGGTFNFAGDADSATGGGASDVRRGDTLEGRLVVGGGGGGGSIGNTPGGNGGGSVGGDGAPSEFDPSFVGGGGGTQTDGGTVGWAEAGYANEPGAFGQGGRCWHDGAGCGGGGGGYYGGGTGGFGGGGGGSGFVDAPGNTSTALETGVQAGDGVVTISW